MKTLQIVNGDSSLIVNYLTDLIGTNDNFAIFQIKTIENGVETLGLSDTAIAAGYFRTIGKPRTIQQFTDFCKNKGFALYSYENLATGSVKTTIWSSGYGDAGAIGEDQL